MKGGPATGDLALRLEPVVNVPAVLGTAREEEFVGASGDFFDGRRISLQETDLLEIGSLVGHDGQPTSS